MFDVSNEPRWVAAAPASFTGYVVESKNDQPFPTKLGTYSDLEEALRSEPNADNIRVVAELSGLSRATIRCRGKRRKLFSRGVTPKERLDKYFKVHKPWNTLPLECLKHLANDSLSEIVRRERAWWAIEDCLMLAFPEEFWATPDDDRSPWIARIWRWTWCTLSHHNGVSTTTKLWKSLCAAIKAAAIQADLPKVISGTIWCRNGDLYPPHMPAKLATVVINGCQTKSDGTMIMHLVSTRGLPAPGREELISSLNEHGEVICGDHSNVTVDPALVSRVAFRMGIRASGFRSNAHLSLSNSAAFEQSRRKGGRAVSIGKLFSEWAAGIPTDDIDRRTIFDQPYWLKAGIPRWRTMCRTEEAPEGHLLQSGLLDNFDFEDYKYSDPMHGLDDILGFQILQWSIEEGIRQGYLEGSPYYSVDNPLKVVGTPCVRASPIGEPGGKSRAITAGEGWLTTLLSPFGHDFIESLSEIPEASIGLTKGALAYEFCKAAAHRVGLDKVNDLHMLTSDLTQASEYLEHEISKTMVKAYMRGIGCTSAYHSLATNLLLSPRYLSSDLPDYVWEGSTTRRGSLMGDPGTKGTLMLTMIVAEEIAWLRYKAEELGVSIETIEGRRPPNPVWRLFRAAGDDHLAIGPRRYLELIRDTLISLSCRISFEKSYISRMGAYFTEELILKTNSSRWEHANFIDSSVNQYETTYHVDSIKVRLLSPCSKTTLVRDDGNPAVGKIKFFLRKLLWLPKGFEALKLVALARFEARFKEYLPAENCLLRYLPEQFGGLGLPRPLGVLESSVHELHWLIKSAIMQVQNGTASEFVKRALWTFRANSSFRGMTLATRAEEELRAIFSFFVADSFPLAQLVEDHQWRHGLRRRDYQRLARKAGYISMSDLLEETNRPTYFKYVMAGIAGIFQHPLYLQLKAAEHDLSLLLEREDMTLSQFSVHNGGIVSFVETLRLAWFAKQSELETYCFERVSGFAGDDNHHEYVPEFELTSFNVVSWQDRMSAMTRILRLWGGDLQRPDDQEIVDLIQNGLLREPQWVDEIYVKESRLVSLCTLRTPLPKRQTRHRL
jgi:hypothetical protein